MKTLAELRTELALGLFAYHCTDKDLCVYYNWYKIDGEIKQIVMYCYIPLGRDGRLLGEAVGYETLDALIADLPIAVQPVWTTLKPA